MTPPIMPACAIEALLLDEEAARDLAASGRAVEGFICLLMGLRLAEELQRDGEPWAEGMAACYRDSLRRFKADHIAA